MGHAPISAPWGAGFENAPDAIPYSGRMRGPLAQAYGARIASPLAGRNGSGAMTGRRSFPAAWRASYPRPAGCNREPGETMAGASDSAETEKAARKRGPPEDSASCGE
jgi:hypothetical protein